MLASLASPVLPMTPMSRLTTFFALLLIGSLVGTAMGQAGPSAAKLAAAAVPGANVHTPDDPDVLHETQLTVGNPGYSGLIWWIPYEFWERSAAKSGRSPEKTREAFKALKDYTVVGIMVAKVSPLGNFEYVTPADLQKKTFVRDSVGKDYPAIPEVSGDAKMVADLIRPILANALGRAGENFAMLFFPGHDASGKQIADAVAKGQFSVVLKDAVGEPETIYQWRTPLTVFSAPRYCPVGNERLHANWDYCPWHGVKGVDRPQ